MTACFCGWNLQMKKQSPKKRTAQRKQLIHELPISDQVEIVRSEPNVSILDLLNMRLTAGSGSRRKRFSAIDNQFREKLGYPASHGGVCTASGPMTGWKDSNILCPCASIFIQKLCWKELSLPWKMMRRQKYSWMGKLWKTVRKDGSRSLYPQSPASGDESRRT